MNRIVGVLIDPGLKSWLIGIEVIEDGQDHPTTSQENEEEEDDDEEQD